MSAQAVKRLACLLALSIAAPALSLGWLLALPASAQEPVEAAVATIYTDTVSIPTYPCVTSTQFNPTYGISYPKYESCGSSPENRSYTRLVLENDYLRLSILPELGGRVYELVYKPSGHNQFYRNPVVKPTPWGPPEQGGWLAAGGLEWGLPVEEHGYEWGVAWAYSVVTASNGVTVTLWDSPPGADRLRAEVAVHLPADQALFRVSHRIDNGRAVPLDFSYWTNAMLAPGAPNTVSADLHFIVPGDQARVHSRDPGDNFLPPDGGVFAWPQHAGRDMSRLGNWGGWLGFFAYPRSQADFAGVYDPSLDEGVMHVFPKTVVLGTKGFGFGWARPIDPANWTDDGSAYVELHNGPQPTFWDRTHLAAGASLTYSDVWYPLAGLGTAITGATRFAATEAAALALTPTPAGFEVGLYSPAARTNVRAVARRLDNGALLDERVLSSLDPATPRRWSIAAPGPAVAGVSLVVYSEAGAVLVAINPLPDTRPPTSQLGPLPPFVESTAFAVSWSGEDEDSGLAGFDVQVRDGVEGSWTGWLTGTTATSATFSAGQDDHTYFFRVRARDGAGNLEAFRDERWGQGFTSVLLEPRPVLVTSRKESNSILLTPGLPVTYTLLISNTGNLTAGLRLTDTLPADLVLLEETLTVSRPPSATVVAGEIRWQGDLPPGEAALLQYQMTTSASTRLLQPYTNTLWLDDGVHPPFSRETVVLPVFPSWFPLILAVQHSIGLRL